MARILFLVHRIPYPPNKGDKIRYWNFFSRLAANEQHSVHLGFFVDDQEDMQHIAHLSKIAKSTCYEFMSPLKQKVNSLLGLLTGRSLTESAYPSAKMKRYVKGLIEGDEIDLIYIASAAPFSWLPGNLGNASLVSDLADVDSQKWHAYAQNARWPLSWLYDREAKTLLKFEQKIAVKSERTVFVTEDEAGLFRELCDNTETSATVIGIKNGVNTGVFDPALYEQAVLQTSDAPKLIFCGAMNYQPNVEAVIWFADNVFPSLKEEFKNVEFIIAGRPVANAVAKLSAIEGVTVTGAVPDMAEEISKAHIVVAPLHTARGIQNKVLEGMAMAKPVIATDMANEGINAANGVEVLIANTPEQYMATINDIMASADGGRAIGDAARRFVEENFSWETSQRELDAVLEEACSTSEKTGG